MENETNKPTQGTWSKMSAEDADKTPRVNFEVNITQKVVFIKNDPVEMQSEDKKSVYYIFDVQQEQKDMIIMTSAWTLLKELKKLNPLAGKVVDITKRLVKGKQFFEVKEFK